MNEILLTQLRILKITDSKPNFSELARIYDLDRRTIKKYYDGYDGKPTNRNKPSKLDKYETIIREKLQIKGTTIRSVYEFIFHEIDSDIGTYSNFNKYLKTKGIKPKKYSKGHPRFETLPGQQGQADWKENMNIANCYGEIFTFQVFDYKLGHSRYCHFTYKTTKTRQDVLGCLISAFKATGGVPKEILFDNMSSVVDLKDGRRHVNNQMKAFADDFHFKIRLAKPRHPFTKGKVETINKFLSWLLHEGEFETEEELILILENINERINKSVCQATNMPPLLLFQKEKEYLQSLPNQKVIESYLFHDRQIKVQKDSMINYKNSKYSVPPAYIGKNVYIRQTFDKLHIYYNTEEIAVHKISSKKLNYNKEHYIELLSNVISNKDDVSEMAETNLKQMDDFDFSFQPGINKKELLEFTSLGFIERNENILFVGTSGVGKTHLVTAIGVECARNRYSTYY